MAFKLEVQNQKLQRCWLLGDKRYPAGIVTKPQGCVSVFCERLRMVEEGEDNGDGPSCAAVGGIRPEKKSLTMDISNCS